MCVVRVRWLTIVFGVNRIDELLAFRDKVESILSTDYEAEKKKVIYATEWIYNVDDRDSEKDFTW